MGVGGLVQVTVDPGDFLSGVQEGLVQVLVDLGERLFGDQEELVQVTGLVGLVLGAWHWIYAGKRLRMSAFADCDAL